MRQISERYYIPLARVRQNPWQTRATRAEKIDELAASISANGLLQPPVGRLVDRNGKTIDPDTVFAEGMPAGLEALDAFVQIAFGHHRLAAYLQLHTAAPEEERWAKIPVEFQLVSDEQMALYGWEENEHRGDLNVVEKGLAIQRYMQDFGWTQEQAAKKLNMDRSTAANLVRMLELPAEALQALRDGTISQRQAMPLLGLTRMSQEMFGYAEKIDHTYYRPSEVLKRALTGKKSSDEIRSEVEEAVIRATVDMSNCQFLLEEFEGDGFTAAICTACKLYSKSQKRCQSPACYLNKKQAWRVRMADQATTRTGIPLADPDLRYNVYKEFYGEEKTLILNVLREKPCPNMRLKEMGYGAIPEGVEGYGVVCQHGEGHKCTCLAAAMKRHKATDPQEIAKKQEIQGVAAAKKEAVALLAEALTQNQAGAWYALWKRHCSYMSGKDKPTPETPVDQVIAWIADDLVENKINYDSRENAKQAKKALGELLEACGQRASWMPEKKTPAQEALEKFARIQGWMADLPREFPSKEMIAGNIANLDKLIETPGLEQAEWDAMDDARTRLQLIQPLVENWTADDAFGAVNGLVTVPMDDDNFRSDLERASFRVIEYALFFVPAEGNKAKRERLKKRGAKLLEEGAKRDYYTPGIKPGETLIAYYERTGQLDHPEGGRLEECLPL